MMASTWDCANSETDLLDAEATSDGENEGPGGYGDVMVPRKLFQDFISRIR